MKIDPGQFNVRQFSSDKILKHLDRVNEWLRGENPFPITVELDITNLCNHRCPECVVSYFRRADKSALTYKTAKNIIMQLAKCKIRGLIFTGGGEPLCNQQALKIVELAKSKGLDLGFITNGSFLDEESGKVLLKNCTWIRVSLDAGTPEVFRLSHGMGEKEFYKVVDNIRSLVAIKKKIKSNCTVGVGFLTCDYSAKDMLKAASLAKELGVDYLQFRPRQIHHGGRFVYKWTDVHGKIAECLKYTDNNFQVLYSKHKYEMAHDPQYGRHYQKCYGQQFAAVISAQAKMFICCHTRGYEKYCIGDLKKNSLKEIWSSKRRKDAVKRINFRDCIPLCRDNTFNQILWNIRQEREHVNFL